MRRRVLSLSFACAYALTHVAAPAKAAGVVLGPSGQGVGVVATRTAAAVGSGQMTRWMQVTVSAAEHGFLWLVPVSLGARVDAVSDAWLDALDEATTRVVLPPLAPPPCGASRAVDALSSSPTVPVVPPSAAVVALDAPSLAALVRGAGAEISADELAVEEAVYAGGLVVAVMRYDSNEVTVAARTLRVVEAAPRDLDVGGGGVLAGEDTTFILAAGPRTLGAAQVVVDPAAVQWGADGRSTYRDAREQALEAAPVDAWVTESAAPGRLFASDAVLSGTDLPPVLSRYFALAANAGDTTLPPGSCDDAALGLSSGDAPVAPSCPAGALLTVPGPSPCAAATTDGATEVTPVPLVCGGAVEAALAASGQVPSGMWVTRLFRHLAPVMPASVSIAVGAAAVPAVLTASGYDSTCESAPAQAAAPASPTPAASSGAAVAIAGAAGGCSASDFSGCDGSSDSSGDSSCDGSSSGDTGGGCSGSTDSGSSCSGSSSGGSNQNNCATAPHARARRGGAARALMTAIALLAYVRRRTRPLRPRRG